MLGFLRRCQCVLSILLFGASCHVRSTAPSELLPRETRDPPPVSLSSFLREKEVHATPGLFVAYTYKHKTYLLVQKKQLGQPFLLTALVSQGSGQRLPPLFGQLTGTGVAERIVSFERHGDRLFLIEKPHPYLAQPAYRKSVAQTFAPEILGAVPIVAVGAKETFGAKSAAGDLLISVDGFFLEDLPSVLGGRDTPKPQRSLSYIDGLRGTGQSVSVRARIGYQSSITTDLGHKINSMLLTYSFVSLPEIPMSPRQADDRIGTFNVTHRDFDSASPLLTAHVVKRWRLEADHREQGLWVPKKPIVFYLDPETPKAYQPHILDGIRQWNHAFLAAGWKEAVRAQVLPKGLTMDDPRIAAVHWDVGEHTLNGRGQPLVDPRSGEILGATLILSNNLLVDGRTWQRNVGGFSVPLPFGQIEELLGDTEEMSTVLGEQAGLIQAALGGIARRRSTTPDVITEQQLRFVAMHEAGHVLGLRHNFRASVLAEVEQLTNKQWLAQNPYLASVMEYPAINLPAPEELLGSKTLDPDFVYYQKTIGPSDVLTIAYAYTPDAKYAEHLAEQAAAWGYLFGSDQEDYQGADPSVQKWDLGKDTLLWAQKRTELLRKLWLRLLKEGPQNGVRPAEYTLQLTDLAQEYRVAAETALAYIGGRWSSRDHVGDKTGKPAFRPVEKQKQRAALSFLCDAILSEEALPITGAGAQNLGNDYLLSLRRPARDQIRSPLWRKLQELRVGLIEELLSPAQLRKMVDGEQVFGPTQVLTVAELLQKVTAVVFSELQTGQTSTLSPLRKELQLRYVDTVGRLLLHRKTESSLGRAQVRKELLSLRKQIDAVRKGKPVQSPEAQAHLDELSEGIAATLNGVMVVAPSGP